MTKKKAQNGNNIKIFLDTQNYEVDAIRASVGEAGSKYPLKTLGATEIVTLIQAGL